ncbi:uncharacterized protein RBU33_012715 [Hipposideros larvatus]
MSMRVRSSPGGLESPDSQHRAVGPGSPRNWAPELGAVVPQHPLAGVVEPLQLPTWQAGFIGMNKKSTHRIPEDAGTSRNAGKQKRKKKEKQNPKHHRSRHRSASSSSDDRVFPSSSSSSGSQTDSSTEDDTKGKMKRKRGAKRNKWRKKGKVSSEMSIILSGSQSLIHMICH